MIETQDMIRQLSTPKKYRKKPVVIESVQYLGLNFMQVCQWIGSSCKIANDKCLVIETLEGDHHAIVGDYIIKGVHGEFYPVKKDIFYATYELVED